MNEADQLDLEEEEQLREIEAKHRQAMATIRCSVCGLRMDSSSLTVCLDCLDDREATKKKRGSPRR